jgi:hypothetical protein
VELPERQGVSRQLVVARAADRAVLLEGEERPLGEARWCRFSRTTAVTYHRRAMSAAGSWACQPAGPSTSSSIAAASASTSGWSSTMNAGHAGASLIDRHPETRFIIDHLAIVQPRTPPAPREPWADLPKMLDLARRPNAVIKVSGACTLSREHYPFPDLWDPLARVFEA